MAEQTSSQQPTGLDAIYPSPEAAGNSSGGPSIPPPVAQQPPAQQPPVQQPPVAQPPTQMPPVAPPPPPPAAPPAYGYTTPPAVPPRRRSCLLTGLIVAVVAAVVFIGIPLLIAYSGGQLSVGDKIGVVTISGMIRSESVSSPLFGTSGGANEWIAQIRAAEKDSSVKVILIRINSPGGSPAASQAVYKAILRARQQKPVLVSMSDLAASGAYYIASAADTIVASPSTLTGSIGVIMTGINYSGLMNKYGVLDQTLTTGPYKDTGSGQRPMRPDEKALVKAMLYDTYDQFVTDVAAGRRMDVAAVKKLADGRIYTGRQAKKANLVDELGDFYDASKLAQQRARPPMSGEPQYKFFRRSSLLSQVLESAIFHEPRTGLVDQALRRELQPCADLLVMPGYSHMQAW